MNNHVTPDLTKFNAVVSIMEQMQQTDPDHLQLAYDMLYLKSEIDGIDPPLSDGELYTLASKTLSASMQHSGCCYLHAERVEAIRVLLEYGTNSSRTIEELPAMDADRMRFFLQTCDMDVFTILVDCVAGGNELFYEANNMDLQAPEYADELSALQTALTAALDGTPPLSAQIANASQRVDAQPSKPTSTQNMER